MEYDCPFVQLCSDMSVETVRRLVECVRFVVEEAAPSGGDAAMRSLRDVLEGLLGAQYEMPTGSIRTELVWGLRHALMTAAIVNPTAACSVFGGGVWLRISDAIIEAVRRAVSGPLDSMSIDRGSARAIIHDLEIYWKSGVVEVAEFIDRECSRRRHIYADKSTALFD